MATEAALKQNPTAELKYNALKRIRGYFCHLAMVFEIIFPFLNVFHLTLSSHLPESYNGGRKFTNLEWLGYLKDKVERGLYLQKKTDVLMDRLNLSMGATSVIIVPSIPRFHQCFKSLLSLMSERAKI